MKLFIKNMVCRRCKLLVQDELKQLGFPFAKVDLGTAEILGNLSNAQHRALKINLLKSGLELLEDKRKILIEKIKNVVIEMVHYDDELPIVCYSNYISTKIGLDYTYLANVFSEDIGVTIQQFIIKHKIERVKQLMMDDGLNLTEASYKLHYSSVAHLSSQFKKVTGVTPSAFMQHMYKKHISLEEV